MSHIMSPVEWFVGQEFDSFIQASEIILSHHIGYSKICQRSYFPLPKYLVEAVSRASTVDLQMIVSMEDLNTQLTSTKK